MFWNFHRFSLNPLLKEGNISKRSPRPVHLPQSRNHRLHCPSWTILRLQQKVVKLWDRSEPHSPLRHSVRNIQVVEQTQALQCQPLLQWGWLQAEEGEGLKGRFEGVWYVIVPADDSRDLSAQLHCPVVPLLQLHGQDLRTKIQQGRGVWIPRTEIPSLLWVRESLREDVDNDPLQLQVSRKTRTSNQICQKHSNHGGLHKGLSAGGFGKYWRISRDDFR